MKLAHGLLLLLLFCLPVFTGCAAINSPVPASDPGAQAPWNLSLDCKSRWRGEVLTIDCILLNQGPNPILISSMPRYWWTVRAISPGETFFNSGLAELRAQGLTKVSRTPSEVYTMGVALPVPKGTREQYKRREMARGQVSWWFPIEVGNVQGPFQVDVDVDTQVLVSLSNGQYQWVGRHFTSHQVVTLLELVKMSPN